MQLQTFLTFVIFLHATTLKAVPLKKTNEDPSARALEFNIHIKNYEGSTTTTEGSIMDKISSSLSSAYNTLKDAVVGSEEIQGTIHNNSPSYPIYIRRTSVPRQKISLNQLQNDAKKNGLETHLVNQFGRTILKETPTSSPNKKIVAFNENGNYFNITLHGVVANSSGLDSASSISRRTKNLNNEKLNTDLKNLVHDIIAVQNLGGTID